MEAQEVYNVPVSELATGLFSIEWSEDNQISLVTERGVHIFELQPNPLCPTPTPKFRRSFIWATDYLPTAVFSPIVETILNNCEREDMYALLYEEALTPKLPDKSDLVPRIIQVAWSPVKLADPSKCLLATVTSAGAIDLIFKVGMAWYTIFSLSEIWWNTIKDEMDFNIENTDVEDIKCDTFKSNLRRLQGTSVTWSNLLTDSNGSFAYLATAYRSSELVVWRINKISEFSMGPSPSIIYRNKFENCGRISKLTWTQLSSRKHLIIIGFFDGRIYGVQLSENDGQLINNEKSVKKYEEYSDKITVSSITVRSQTKGGILTAVAKNIHFVLLNINREGNLIDKKYLQLPGFSISGILFLNDLEVMVSTQNSNLHLIKLDCNPLKHCQIYNDMKAFRTQYLGLAKAPHGTTFVNVTSPNTMYDHLINRDPSNLQFFFLKSPDWDPWCTLEKSQSNLYAYWDCLELIRIRAARATDGEHLFPKIPDVLDQSVTTHHLRVMMWLTLITEVVKKKKVLKKIDNIVGEISKAQPLIFIYTISDHLVKLGRRKILSDDHRLSIHFLRLYLEVFLAGEENDSNGSTGAISHAEEAMQMTSNVDLIKVETCNLCGEIVEELPWNTSKCPKGHHLARCALTLLQITSLKYRSCPVCGRIFHPSLDEEYEEMRCLYCDVPAVFDSRVVGIYDEIEKGKNLSVKPTWDYGTSNRGEGDGGEKDESKENKNRVGKENQGSEGEDVEEIGNKSKSTEPSMPMGVAEQNSNCFTTQEM